MLKEIIRKEILEHLMSLRFAIACVLCFVVVLCSLFVRLRDYNLVMDDYAENSAQARARLTSSRMDHPWDIVYRGLTVHQSPNPLKIFVRGVETANGISVHLTGHRPVQFFGTFLANPLVPLFPAMDMISFVGIIMSLLAIVFGYDAICGEKQHGTLRLMLSYSVPRDLVLLGKWIGGLATLVVPFVLTVIAAVTIVLIQPNISLTQTEWFKFAGVAALALLYITAVFSLALWISSITPRPATSIMILITVWLILVLAVPNLSPYLAQSARPTLNPAQLETARLAKTKEIWQQQIDDKVAAYNKEHGFTKDRWWDEVNWKDNEDWKRGHLRWMFELECRGNAFRDTALACRRLDEDLERRLDAQISLSRWISRLSPFSCFAMAATELTDTGLLSKRRFVKQVRDYQEKLSDFGIKEWLRRDQIELEVHGTDKEKKMPDWPSSDKPIPRFAFTPPAGTEYLRLIVLDAGILAALTLVFLMLSFVGFLRYDVR